MSRVFRDRAEECRSIAEMFRAEKAREHLLKVAADYESMADKAAILNSKMLIGRASESSPADLQPNIGTVSFNQIRAAIRLAVEVRPHCLPNSKFKARALAALN